MINSRFVFHSILGLVAIWLMQCVCDKLLATDPTPVRDGFKFASNDWPWWRGPNRNGEAVYGQTPPSIWSDNENVLWKVPLAGRGHGSFCIIGNRIFLQTADESNGAQFVVCLQRSSGKELWKTTVHASGGMRKNEKSSAASSTPACDGEFVFVSFPNGGTLTTTALDLSGKQKWQTKISDYVEHQGYGASPTLYQSLVIVSSDNKGGGAIAALDRKTGEFVWTRDRPKQPNYSSPVILNVASKDQLILTGCDKVSSFEPLTGKTIWEVDGATTECVTSTVTDGQRVFSSGGYPKNHMSAILADGSGKIEWETGTRLYVPSMLIREGYLYGVLDAGIAICWDARTGQEQWKQRLGGTFSSSPVLVGDSIYATNEGGDTYLFKANKHKYEELGKNHLGDEVLSTPVICGNRIYYRATTLKGDLGSEFIYCIGKE